VVGPTLGRHLVHPPSGVDVEIVRTAGRTERVEGLSSWGGRLTAGHWVQVTPGESLELRLPDGRSGHVFLANTAGELVGASKTPAIESTRLSTKTPTRDRRP
jgi:hypothetical protein